jgi:hypothetical protein
VVKELATEAKMLAQDLEKEPPIHDDEITEKEAKLIALDASNGENALAEIETAVANNQQPSPEATSRLKQFVDDLGNEKSTLRKGIGLLRRGKDYGVKILAKYNTIAADLGLDAVPESFLGL